MNGTIAALTPAALRRWSCQDEQLPPVESVTAIHIYDFDNTLFASPLPNKQIWSSSTYGQLQAQDFLHNGGWWHNPRMLASTGRGEEVEEKRAWEGFWNEKIVDLVRLSMQEEDALNVLLTGRGEDAFAQLVGRMVKSKGLEFDIVALKPKAGLNGEVFGSTMQYKQALLKDLVVTYAHAEEIRIYEDRPKHVKGFRDYFDHLNKRVLAPNAALRAPITAEVIQVSEQETFMDPTTEVAEVQRMVNVHNGTLPPHFPPYKIKRSVFYTGYLIPAAATDQLKALVTPPPNCPDHELRHLANNILITPRPAPPNILAKVGGFGAKMFWRVTGLGVHENRVWAARVQPTVRGAVVHTENATPYVVLATRRQAKPVEAGRIQHWQAVSREDAVEFETTVGEKALLRVEEDFGEEDAGEDAGAVGPRGMGKRARDEEFPPLGGGRGGPARGKMQSRGQGRGGGAHQGRGGGGGGGGGVGAAGQRGGGGQQGRGGGRGARGGNDFRGRGRGGGGQKARGRGSYRSLDDSVGQSYGGSGMQY